MPNVYVEARPKGRPEGSAIEDSWWRITPITCSRRLKPNRRPSAWSTKQGHTPLIARVRHLNDKEKPDHWRAG